MAITAKTLIEFKTMENSQTTQYTSTNVTTIIDKFTSTNFSAGAVTVSVHLVPKGSTASNSNMVVSSKTIQAGQTYTFPEVVGQILNPGNFISTVAGTASALNLTASGKQIS